MKIIPKKSGWGINSRTETALRQALRPTKPYSQDLETNPQRNQFFSAPTAINLEITDKCNAACRHCYNYWREERSRSVSMSIPQLDRLVDMILADKVFHVILSGGEPFLNFTLLEYACKRFADNQVSISVNSNLMLAKPEQLKRLHSAGVDHILTTLNSYDANTSDFLVNASGAHRKIVTGIEKALQAGIRISANMILSKANVDHVYDTALFAHRIGVQKIFGTRLVPPERSNHCIVRDDFLLSADENRNALDQLVSAKQETGILIGSLVSYPLCFLKDLERYQDFVGRGCPSQAGHRMNINADGTAHCCVHESRGYGNVFENGIKGTYAKMHAWHDGGLHHTACLDCPYLGLCQSGCRMSALGHNGKMNAADPLMTSPADIKAAPGFMMNKRKYRKRGNPTFDLSVAKSLRFRPEQDFWLVNIRWANTIRIDEKLSARLCCLQKTGRSFPPEELGLDDPEMIWHLLEKGVLLSSDYKPSREASLAGLSLDPSFEPASRVLG